jgi:hypothetical protein
MTTMSPIMRVMREYGSRALISPANDSSECRRPVPRSTDAAMWPDSMTIISSAGDPFNAAFSPAS